MGNEKKHLFEHPKNVKRLLHFLYGGCALLFVLDFVIHRHVIHQWENLWGFYPIYGFVGCVVLVRVATWMRTFLMRAENYYDFEGQESESRDSEGKEDIHEQHKGKYSKNNNANNVGNHNVDA